MPALNLKFKGNKSFVAFSNLADTESLTKTWKVCTKVASFLEQGQRLENLSWRLWHLQNLMVDSDDTKSKREFKKLSKHMGDKLDKEKGRNIEDLQAPGFRRNPSTDMIQQRALEKERSREASQSAKPGTLKRTQFTFSVDQPQPASAGHTVNKPDYKPSAEFKEPHMKRPKPVHAKPGPGTASGATPALSSFDADIEMPLTQRGRKSSISTQASEPLSEWSAEAATLRFPSLFSSDFGPIALLNPTPTVRGSMCYGEDVGGSFAVARPTLELPLDDILSTLSADSPDSFSYGRQRALHDVDVVMQPPPVPAQQQQQEAGALAPSALAYYHHGAGAMGGMRDPTSMSPPTLAQAASLMSPPQTVAPRDTVPKAVSPSKLGQGSDKPKLTLKTSAGARTAAAPGATVGALAAGSAAKAGSNSSAPGGVKAECSNCGATHTPLWRRGLNDELNCNACGLYCKLHKRPRPKSMRNSHGEGRASSSRVAAPASVSASTAASIMPGTSAEGPAEVASATPAGRARSGSASVLGSSGAQCYNCHTTTTPLWRKDDEGKTVCNACGLYYKLHGSARPISMKSDVIRKRSRHDARRSLNGIEQTPSASPGASRRASPTNEISTPTFAPDSSTTSASSVFPQYDFQGATPSELMKALGQDLSQPASSYAQDGLAAAFTSISASFPGPYHPDWLAKNYVPVDALPYATGIPMVDDGGHEHDAPTSKRRRMSEASTTSSNATDPPLSAVSYSSYESGFSTAATSVSGMSQYASYSSYNMMRAAGSQPSFWNTHTHSPQSFIHPPMLPPEDGSMEQYLQQHAGHAHDDSLDNLFSAYLHPPMMLPESPNQALQSLHGHQLHPPMLPPDWNSSEFFSDVGMQAAY